MGGDVKGRKKPSYMGGGEYRNEKNWESTGRRQKNT